MFQKMSSEGTPFAEPGFWTFEGTTSSVNGHTSPEEVLFSDGQTNTVPGPENGKAGPLAIGEGEVVHSPRS